MRKFVVTSVLDLRKEPAASSHVRGKDSSQETQSLYGDEVIVESEQGDWSYVRVPDQLIFNQESGFQGYPGWVETKYLSQEGDIASNAIISAKWAEVKPNFFLSMGTKLSVQKHPKHDDFFEVLLLDGTKGEIAKSAVEKKGLLEKGFQLIGDPYLWGGYSAYNPKHPYPLTGVDCSGLVHMLYRMEGTILPRNASDQIRVTKAVLGKDMQPGDLIFLKNIQTKRIYHVMLYAGDDSILEATMLSNTVRFISCKERLGASISTLTSGHIFEDSEFFFGTLCQGIVA